MTAQRIDYKKASPGAFQAMLVLEKHAHQAGIEPALLELVKTRVSQLNGCAYCLAIVAINGWNRLAVSFGTEAGSFELPKA